MKLAISSAKYELYGYRKAAASALRDAGADVVLLDDEWGLRPRQLPDLSVVDGVRATIGRCDGLVVIFGRDTGLRVDAGKVTLLEYELAAAEI